MRKFLLLLLTLFAVVTLGVVLAVALTDVVSLPAGTSITKSIRAWLEIEPNAKIVGLILTLMFGAAGLARSWWVGVDRLPRNLRAYLDLCKQSLIDERDLLIGRVPAAQTPQAAPRTWWERRQRLRQRRTMAEYVAQLDRAPSNPEDEMHQMLERWKMTFEAHRITSIDKATFHYVRGLDYVRLADSGQAPVDNRVKALKEFQEAASLDDRDHRLHERFVEELERAGKLEDLHDAHTAWVSAAANQGAARAEGLALHSFGRFLFQRSADPSLTGTERTERLNRARAKLETAVERLQSNSPTGSTSATDVDLAKCLEVLGDVRVGLKTIPTAIERYKATTEILHALKDWSGVHRVREKLDQLSSEVPTIQTDPHKSVLAFLQLADVVLIEGGRSEAQAYAINANARLERLRVPFEISEADRARLQSRIMDLQRRIEDSGPRH